MFNKLDNLYDRNPKEYWSVFKDLKQFCEETKINPISPKKWIAHFSNLMNKVQSGNNNNINMKYVKDTIDNRDTTFSDLARCSGPSKVVILSSRGIFCS